MFLTAENGQIFSLRTCEGGSNVRSKVGTCENQQITIKAAGTKTVKTCYCGEDLCNGTGQINPSVYTLVSLMITIFMMIKIYY